MSAIKFLSWILGIIFTLGLADSFAHLTYKMGQTALNAHQHDQISYSSYNKLLWQQNPAKQAAVKARH